jgi:hypothetical protein
MISFQRVDSISNAHVGSDFEKAAQDVLASQNLHLVRGFSLPVGISEKKKEHRFDLGSASPEVIVECKSHKWTAGGFVPSAKMTVWNEAMYYFALAPETYRKILFVLRDYSAKKGETLAEYYIRTYDHLVPDEVEIWEFDEDARQATIWKQVESKDPLKDAFEAAHRLPEDEQDAMAEWLLAEISSEEHWNASFKESQQALSALTREALDEHERGKTEELDPDSL